MTGAEVEECMSIIRNICPVILSVVDARSGRETSPLRRFVGVLYSNAEQLLQDGGLAAQLILCLSTARELGAELVPFGRIRTAALEETPLMLPGVSVKQSIVRFALAQEARIVASMTFVSVDDAASISSLMNAAFSDAAEIAADELDAGSYMAIIRLRADVSRFLSDTARLLPKIVRYSWQKTMPSLTMAQRVYQDASRSDEIVSQNKIVHPAFCPTEGKMLAI